MAGTLSGGKLAAATNKKNDPDFYVKIGTKGGKKGTTGGFAAGEEGRERARKWGKIGGSTAGKVRTWTAEQRKQTGQRLHEARKRKKLQREVNA